MASSRKKDGDWFSWALMVFFFAVGAWPVGLFLLFIKLFGSDDKKKQAAPPPLQADVTCRVNPAEHRAASPQKAKKVAKKVTKSPTFKKSNIKWLKIIGIVLLAVVILAGGLIGYLTITEFRPASVQDAAQTAGQTSATLRAGESIRVLTFNTGYAGLDKSQDFFMDGGSGVSPTGGRAKVEENLAGILAAIQEANAQIVLLQEVDQSSARTNRIDETAYYQQNTGLNAAYAINYQCGFVPFPLPPIGAVKSGVLTLSAYQPAQAQRQSLPVPFKWPIRVANLKRCLLVERIPVADSGRELVLINLHLEAYDDGEGKAAQTRQLLDFIHQEYEKGNYVIAGGDFNQTFEGVQRFGGSWEGKWTPGVFTEDELPQGVRLVYDPSLPTCRSLDQAYTGDRDNHVFYLIDGFLVTDNVQVEDVHTVDLDFAYSDHNPMLMQVTLL